MLSLIKVLSLFSFLFYGCTKKQDLNERVLNLVSTAKVKGMDPIYAADLYSGNEVSRVYEGLLQYHYLKRPYVLEPNLAESMPEVSSDGLTYTFKLRKGVFFHDNKCFPGGIGRELKASDVVYSIKRIADPKLQSTGWWVLDGKIAGLNEWRKLGQSYETEVEGVKALDDYTVVFKLAKPFPQFLYALAMPFHFIVAREAVEFYKSEFLNYPVGTGPFILTKFDQSNTITYVKNPKFREKLYPSEGAEGDKEKGLLADAGKRLPLVDKIVVQIIVESQPMWLSFQKGQLDLLGIPKDNFDSVVTSDKKLSNDYVNKGMSLFVEPSLDITYIAFNNEDKIFKNNVKLRRAMSMALDEAKANELFFNSNGLLAQSIVPPGIAGYIPDYKNPYKEFNIEKAKLLLKEAGFPDGKGLPPLRYETNSSTQNRQMGEFFAKSMEAIGIKVNVNTNTWPELVKKVNTRDFQLYAMAWSADYPDAENFLQLLYGPNKAPGSNGSNFNHPEFNQLFEKAAVLQDGAERTALYEKMVRIAGEEVPMIYGIHRMSFVLTHGWVKNYKKMEFDHGQSQYLNIDLEAKKELLPKL